MNPRPLTKMRKTSSLLLDIFFVLSVVVVLTALTPFLTEHSRDYFRSHPKHHRLMLSVMSVFAILIFSLLHAKFKDDSLIFSFFKGLRWPFKTWLCFVFLVAFAVFGYSSYIRHHVFASSFDFAIFTQAVWNTWHGSFLYSSIKGGICLLGDHVSPILVLFAPIFGFGFHPTALLMLQAGAAAGAVFPLYALGKTILKDELLAFLFVVSFVLYLPLRNSVRFDFHPEIFAIPLILCAFYWVIANRLLLASVSLGLVFMTKEVACLSVAMFGLYVWFFQKKFRFGISWFLISAALFFADIHFIAPHFSGQPYFYLSGNYSAWKSEGLMTLLRHLFQPSSFTYLKKIFLPVGLFSFLSPSTLILTVPPLIQNLSARNELTRSIFFQYTAYLTPFVFISAIYGFRNCVSFFSKVFPINRVKVVMGYWLIIWSILLSGVSEYHVIREYQRKDNPHFNYVRNYFKTIPSTVSVRTHEVFAPHLANRKELFIFENNHPKEGGSEQAMNAGYVVLDRKFISGFDGSQISNLLSRGYQIKHEHDGFYVLAQKNS